jgi:HAD superfamily phosphatase (TIGR01668 family)
MLLPSILSIQAEPLRKAGIKALLLDADNTLFPHKAPGADKATLAKLRELQKSFRLALVTNDSSQKRRQGLRKHFASNKIAIYACRSPSRKPSKAPFLEAAAALGVSPENCAVAGDNMFTDVLGANSCGMLSIKVPPVDAASEPWYFPPMRLAEAALLLFWK